jgi:hypothetical protein
MATASFAGTIANAEEASPKAPKGCFVYNSPCGPRILCGAGVSPDESSPMRTVMIIEALADCF